MATEQFNVANVKCQGCAANIRAGLSALPGVENVEVDVATGWVAVNGAALDRAALAARLAALGYPEKAPV